MATSDRLIKASGLALEAQWILEHEAKKLPDGATADVVDVAMLKLRQIVESLDHEAQYLARLEAAEL